MTIETWCLNRLGDNSLVGADINKAIQAGLAETRWYASPVTKAPMRELLERRDAPALEGIALWFLLLVSFFGGRLSGVGHVVGHYSFLLLRRTICLDLRRALARNGEWQSFHDRLAQQCGFPYRSVA